MTLRRVALTLVLVACSSAPSRPAAPPTGADAATSMIEPRPFAWPTIHERRLNNGVRLLVVERRDLPLLRLSLIVRRGSADAAPGVASYAVSVLPSAIAEIPGLAGNVWANYDAVGIDTVGITRFYRSSNLPSETFGVLCKMLQAPPITTEHLERERRRRLAWTDSPLPDPNGAVVELERQALYPEGHPYRQPAAGDRQATQAVTFADIVRFYREQVQPDQVAVVAVGDVARESFLDAMNLTFGRWQGRAVERKPLPEPILTPPGGGAITLVDQPGSNQARILVAARGVPWQSGDFYALFMLHTIAGGSYGGRLNLNLREAHVYSYGSYSSFEKWRGSGPFEAFSVVATQNTGAALQQMARELRRLREEPLRDEELALAKRAAIRRLPMMFSTLAATVHAVTELAAYDRPADEYDHLAERIDAVSAEEMMRVARTYLAADKLRWFVVGDANTLRETLSGSELGPVALVRSVTN